MALPLIEARVAVGAFVCLRLGGTTHMGAGRARKRRKGAKKKYEIEKKRCFCVTRLSYQTAGRRQNKQETKSQAAWLVRESKEGKKNKTGKKKNASGCL